MKPTARLRSFLLGSSLLAAPLAHSASLYWDSTAGGVINDGAGAWLGAGQWNNAGTPSATWTSGDNAIFGNFGVGGAVTLASATAVGSLTFNYNITTGYTLGTAANTITLNNGITKNAGSQVVAFASNITLGAAQTWTNNSATNLANPVGARTLNNGGFNLTFDGTGSFNMYNGAGNTMTISGGGGIIKNGTGDLNLDSNPTVAHSFTGNIVVNGGSIGYQTGSIFNGKNTTLNGGYLGGRFDSNASWTSGLGTGANQIQITGGVSGFSGESNSDSVFTIGTALSTLKWGATGVNGATGYFNPTVFFLNGSSRMNANGTGTFNNGIDLNGSNRTFTSNHTNWDGASATGGVINGAIVNTAGTAAGIIRTGIGNLSLVAANTYNGATTINGGTLTLRSSGTANSTSALNLGGGILRLVNTANTQRFADGAAVTVSAGGGITYENTAGANLNYTETLGSVALNGGLLNVNLATNQNNATNNSQTLTFGGLTQSGTGSVAFSAATTGPQASVGDNMIVVTGSGTTTAGEIIGAWATTGTAATLQTDYAVYNGNYVTAANIAASAQSTWSTTHALGSNYTLSNAGGTAADGRLSVTRNINSVRNTSSATNIAYDAATDLITLAGHTFTNGEVVTFGGTAPGNTVNGEVYYVRDVSGSTFKVAASSVGAAIDLTGANAANITGGITLATGVNLGTYGILNAAGSALVIGAGTGGVVTLPTAVSDNLYVNVGNATTTITAPIANNGAGILTLVKNGSGTLRMHGVNTYTGNTAINSGTLQIGFQGNPGGPTTGGKLGGASGIYAGNIFIGAGATLFVNTDANQTLSGIISGDGGLTKGNTGTLTLGDANTYTGKTTLTYAAPAGAGGGITIVSSFNSVNGGTPLLASSSLGAPTTIANGTIDFGNGSIQASNTLRYGGVLATGETTDRIINFIFNNASSGRTLEALGSGLLKFTSAPTGSGNGPITLGGSGSGEFTQGLPFAFTTVTKSGASTWTLGGAVGATGNFTLDGATAGSRLNINHSQALGTGTFIISGGNNATIGNTSGADITLTANNAQTWSNDFAVVATNSLNMGTGAVSMVATRAIAVSGAGTFTVGGVVSGATFGITLGGSGTMALTNQASTFTGKTIIGNNVANTLKLQVTKLADLSATSSLGAPTTAANGLIQIGLTSNPSTLELIGGTSASTTNRQVQIGSSSNGSGGATILNNNTNSTHTLTFSNAAFNVAATGVTSSSRSLTLGGSNTGDNTITGAIIPNTGGAGLTSLVKSGAGKWILAGTNTYTGTTTVSDGTLLINGNSSTANGAVNVNAGTLGGIGRTGGAVTVGATATLSPGASIESLDVASLSMASTSVFAYEVADNTSTGADLLASRGALSLTGVTLSLDALSLAALASGVWNPNDKLTLISYLGADITSGFSGYLDDTSYFFGLNEWKFDYNDTVAGGNYGTEAIAGGQDRFVTMTVVIPEPNVAALIGGFGVLALLRRRR